MRKVSVVVASAALVFAFGFPASAMAAQVSDASASEPKMQPRVSIPGCFIFGMRVPCDSLRQQAPTADPDEANNAPEAVTSAVRLDGDELDDILTTPGEAKSSRRDVAKVDRQLSAILEDYEACEGDCALNIQVHVPKSISLETTAVQPRSSREWLVTCELSKESDTVTSDGSLSVSSAATLASDCVLADIAEELERRRQEFERLKEIRALYGFVTVIPDQEPVVLGTDQSAQTLGDEVWEDMYIDVLVQDLDSVGAEG